jgi:hypothetical protein
MMRPVRFFGTLYQTEKIVKFISDLFRLFLPAETNLTCLAVSRYTFEKSMPIRVGLVPRGEGARIRTTAVAEIRPGREYFGGYSRPPLDDEEYAAALRAVSDIAEMFLRFLQEQKRITFGGGAQHGRDEVCERVPAVAG